MLCCAVIELHIQYVDTLKHCREGMQSFRCCFTLHDVIPATCVLKHEIVSFLYPAGRRGAASAS